MLFTKEELAQWDIIFKAIKGAIEEQLDELTDANLDAADREAEEMEGRRNAE